MTRDQFQLWLSRHCTRFSGLRAHFEKEGNSAELESAWFDVVDDLEFEDCCRATDEMFKHTDKQPQGFTKHPGRIRFLVKVMNGGDISTSSPAAWVQVIDGELVFQCQHCEDTGLVLVWSVRAIESVRSGDGRRHCWNVACTCRIGDLARRTFKRKREIENQGIEQYRPDDHIRCYGKGDNESWFELLDRYDPDGVIPRQTIGQKFTVDAVEVESVKRIGAVEREVQF